MQISDIAHPIIKSMQPKTQRDLDTSIRLINKFLDDLGRSGFDGQSPTTIFDLSSPVEPTHRNNTTTTSTASASKNFLNSTQIDLAAPKMQPGNSNKIYFGGQSTIVQFKTLARSQSVSVAPNF